MSNIINFNKTNSEVPTCELVLDILKEYLPELEEVFVLYKHKDNTINVLETSVSIQDKALMLQLLQHSITMDLNSDLDYEGEL